MIKELIALANHLDNKGLTKEADIVDNIIRKSAGEFEDYMAKEMGHGNEADPNTASDTTEQLDHDDIYYFASGKHGGIRLTESYDFLRERRSSFKEYARKKYNLSAAYNPVRKIYLDRKSGLYDPEDVEEAKILAVGGDKNDLLRKKEALLSMIELFKAVSDKYTDRGIEDASNIINNNEILSSAFSEVISKKFSLDKKDYSTISSEDLDDKIKDAEYHIKRIDRVIENHYSAE